MEMLKKHLRNKFLIFSCQILNYVFTDTFLDVPSSESSRSILSAAKVASSAKGLVATSQGTCGHLLRDVTTRKGDPFVRVC